jgi:hypothetical protein
MAWGAEGISPLLPGATTGGAAGALPPDGIYFSTDAEYEYGHVVDGAGNTARTPGGEKIKEKNISVVPSILWVPGWEVWGARYGAAIAQPYKFTQTHFHGGSDNSIVDSNGLVNTSISPAILSWDLGNGYHLGTGLAVVLPNGKFDYSYSAAEGRKVKSSTTIGNDYWTFEPNLAISYLNNGWNFTLNNIVDINTKNHTTDYQSGNFYYLDATAAKTIDHFTVGVIGNYTQQISDDKIGGHTVAAVNDLNSEGSQVDHVLIGPLLGYDFGSFSVTARFLYALHAENDQDNSFFHVGFTVPIKF